MGIDEIKESALMVFSGPKADAALDLINRAYLAGFEKCKELMSVEDPERYEPNSGYGSVTALDAVRSMLTVEEYRGWCKGNAVKYIWRCERKGGNADLLKAADFIKWCAETEEE